MSHVMNTYVRQPLAFARGRGVRLTDTNGKEYLDALSGIAVNTLGHAHPELLAAIQTQAAQLIHTSNLYEVDRQNELADLLVARTGMSEAFFCNSGCEANEAAIKIARYNGHKRGVQNPAIIVMEHAFHGRTMATLSATGNRKVQVGFEPLVSGFLRVPYNDISAVRQIAAHHQNVVAVLLEIIQGEGGVHLAGSEYLRELRQLCDAQDWLLMCDEVQCGMGRTGKWFAYQHAGIVPDVVTLAKGLGSGIPIGACLAGGKAAGTFGPGNHGSTFGGNPLACAAAIATIKTIETQGLLAHASKIGQRLRQGFAKAFQGLSGVVDIRGQGLMIGIQLNKPCGELVDLAREAGLLINVTSESVIRLLPALIISEEEADELVARLSPVVIRFLQSQS